MSAMTEARLAEIATKINSSTSLEQDCADAINEVRRLRECIKKAPHANDCIVMTGKDADIRQFGCTCWQREALGDSQ